MPLRDGDNLVFSSPLQETERRAGLRRLDDLLGALEELNMREVGEIPAGLEEKIRAEGLPVRGHTISDLIDLVLGSQEDFLLKERRTGPMRRRRTYRPSEEELFSQILQRVRR